MSQLPSPEAYRQHAPPVMCASCGGDPGAAPHLSPQGHAVCGRCFHAITQRAAYARAAAAGPQTAFYFGNESALDAGVQRDVDARLLRRCASCRAHAVQVVHVTFHYVNGITSGRSYQHRCVACAKEFYTESLWRSILEIFSGAFVLVIGAAMLGAGPEGWFGWLLVLLLPVGLLMIGASARRIIARFRNPPVPRLG
jgi:hypothetical protein